jgi:hypothetical protein
MPYDSNPASACLSNIAYKTSIERDDQTLSVRPANAVFGQEQVSECYFNGYLKVRLFSGSDSAHFS